MIHKLKRFLALSFAEKILFLEAYTVLGLMRAAILTISFKRLTRSLHHSKYKIKPDPLSAEELDTARLVGRIITQAAGNTPWESACLTQVLTAQRMLQKRNIPGMFYLGVNNKKSAGEEMSAHAWSQCGDEIITGEGGT